jgi:hypothetical protein
LSEVLYQMMDGVFHYTLLVNFNLINQSHFSNLLSLHIFLLD